jgi:predicted O-methyltransferase YrrM
MDFTINRDIGQLHPEERKLLYDTVISMKPSVLVEIGTWKGMGSTYYTSSALKSNNRGLLHTFEINPEFRDEAIGHLRAAGVIEYVRSYLGDFLTEFPKLNINIIDFAFIDGPEDGDYTLRAFNCLNNMMRSKSCIIMHDWKSEKCRCMREILNTQCGWTIDTILDSEVGICKIIKQ